MNFRLEKWVLAPQQIHEDCYSFIRELVHENLRLFEKLEKFSNTQEHVIERKKQNIIAIIIIVSA